MLFPTPPSMYATPSISTGSNTAGSAALASTESTAGPDDSSTSRPVSTSTATTCSGIGASSSRSNVTWRSISDRSGPVVEQAPAPAGEREQTAPGIGREHVGAVQPLPHLREVVDRRVGMTGEPRPVERADRGADDHVGADAPLAQRGEHPDLDRAEARAARENECNRHRVETLAAGPRRDQSPVKTRRSTSSSAGAATDGVWAGSRRP